MTVLSQVMQDHMKTREAYQALNAQRKIIAHYDKPFYFLNGILVGFLIGVLFALL